MGGSVMAGTKTKATERTVADFISSVDHPVRRADAEALVPLFERISGEPATMWGPSIIGFGRYHYRYDSGHEGDMCRIGFSPRAAQLVFYIDSPASDALMVRLGKHKRGKACLYVNKLADVNVAVLAQMIRAAWDDMAERYPA
jgi:hypothetical protein